MELYTLDNLNLREIKALRQSLDFIQITGVDAMFIGLLQSKLTQRIEHIEIPKETPPPKSKTTKKL